MRRKLEYAAAWPFIKISRTLPRPLSRALAIWLCADRLSAARPACDAVGMRNLAMAFPEKSEHSRTQARSCAASSPRSAASLAELCQFPALHAGERREVVVYDGLENYERAYARNKGVLFLTAHFGGWELSAFAHSLHGHWLHVVMRPMDNHLSRPLTPELPHDAREQNRDQRRLRRADCWRR